MRSVREIRILQNIPVLVRGALNVPIVGGGVGNDYRLRRAVPTLSFLASHGARVVVVSHLGEQGTETLAPVARALGKLLPRVSFCPATIGSEAREAMRTLSAGHVLVLENLRRDRREKENDPSFTRELAALADIFVQDSFDTCHRTHASIVGVPQLLPSYAGLLVEDEVRELSKALTPKRPSLAVIGGAKFTTKEPVLSRLLESYDHVFPGGALANDFLKAAGHEVGKSLVSSLTNEDAGKMRTLLKNPKLSIPVDSRVVDASLSGKSNALKESRVVREAERNDVILDHGSGTAALLSSYAREAKTILWNGPLGKYEDGFTEVTDLFARAVAESKAFSLIGGGDTIAAVERLGILDRFSFVSTGGGAMLEFLSRGSLPGIDALR